MAQEVVTVVTEVIDTNNGSVKKNINNMYDLLENDVIAIPIKPFENNKYSQKII